MGADVVPEDAAIDRIYRNLFCAIGILFALGGTFSFVE